MIGPMTKKRILIALILLAGAIAVGVWINNSVQNPVQKEPPEAWNSRSAQMEALDSKLQALANDIQAYQGTGRCESNEQCKVVGLGPKLCDRHMSSVLYSLLDADEAPLLQKIREFNETSQQFHALSYKTKNCGTPLPATLCVGKKCKAYPQ